MRVIFIILFIGCLLNGVAQNINDSTKIRFNKQYQEYDKESAQVSVDTNVKRVHKLLKDFTKIKQVDSTSLSNRNWLYLSLVTLKARQKQFDSSQFYFEYVLNNVNDKEILSKAYNNKANIEIYLSNHDKGLEYYYNALKLLEDLGKTRAKQVLLINLCTIYRLSERFDLSSEVLKILKQSIKDSKSVDQTIIFRSNLEEFHIKTHEKKYDEALEIMKAVDTTNGLLDSKYNFKQYHFLTHFAYSNLSQYKKALYHLDKSIKSTRTNPNMYPIQDHIYYAKIYNSKGQFSKALSELNKVKEFTISNNPKISQQEYYELYYLINDTLGFKNKALASLKKYNELKAELDKVLIEKQANILKFEVAKDYEIDKLNKEKLIQNIKHQESRKIYTYIVVIILVVSISLILIFFTLNKRQKDKKDLELKNRLNIIQLKNQYLENISHEFKTPLNINMGYLDLIKLNTLKPNKIKEYISKSLDSNKKLLRYLDEFLTYLKLENSELPIADRVEKKNLFNFLKVEIEKFKHECHIKHLQLIVKTNINEDFDLNFDYSKLEKVFNNLMSNAIKYSKPHKKIHFCLFIKNDKLTIEVIDEGQGIAYGEQQKIFERFYQSARHDSPGGFGIGLSLVKDIVISWGGTINVESEIGKGAKFKLSIPLTSHKLTAAEGIEQHITILEKQNSKESTNLLNTTILIVEDNIEMIDYINIILKPLYNCVFAFNGKEALEILNKIEVRLIIADYKMPILNGLELKNKLNQTSKWYDLPFVLISSSPINGFVDKLGFKENINFIQKPFKADLLLYIVNKHIGKDRNITEVTTIQNQINQDKIDAISRFLKKVNTYILEHLDDDSFKVEDLANHMGYSQKQLTKIINDYTGQTTIQIIKEIRLLKAYEYIKNKKFESLSQVMDTVNINSRTHFNKQFYERFGIKPGEMFKEYKHRN